MKAKWAGGRSGTGEESRAVPGSEQGAVVMPGTAARTAALVASPG